MKTHYLKVLALSTAISMTLAAQADDLKISMYTGITGFDPHDTSKTASYSVQSGIFERLFQFDKDMKVIPWLATSYTANDTATEFHLTLRQGVKFSDGTPFNAEAVKVNLDRLADQSLHLKRNSLFNMVDSVTVTGPYSVDVKLKSPFGAFINTLAHPSAVMQSPANFKKYPKESDLSVHPVGTGPYEFKDWAQGKQIVLVKNPNYWRKGWPKFDSVTFYPQPEDATRVAALKSGQVQAIYPLPAELLPTVQSDPKLKVASNNGIYLYYLAPNNLHPPFDNVKVRQALNYAINRNIWLKAVFAGMGETATSPLPSHVQFYKKMSSPDYAYDPKKAKAMLTAAKFPFDKTFELWTTNATPAVRAAQFLKQQLGQVGVKVKVIPMDSTMKESKLFGVKDPKKAQYDLYYAGWSASTGDADWALRPIFATQSWIPTAYNTEYFSDKSVDAAIQAGLDTADPAKRAAAYADAQEKIWNAAPVVFLGSPDTLVGTVKNLEGVYELADGSFVFDEGYYKK